jgi:UDP-N-acetylmuramoyl-tripeptide--D-alanyl-D-alanine ligase
MQRSANLLTLERLADWGQASCNLPGPMRKRIVLGVSNDSRALKKGEVFVALTTEKDDGHRYVSAALKQGAIAAIVAKKNLSQFPESQRSKLVAVRDPLRALQRIAAQYRKTFAIPFIGITGSSGKTTARTFIAEVLRSTMKVGETAGNLNNHLGVPLSLLRFTGNEDVGVLEMGANHTREIHLLSTIVRPSIAIITSIGYAHIGYFGSLANILKAKLEIVDGMDDDSGFLMLNGDDRLLVAAAKKSKKNVVLFGFSEKCEVRAQNFRVLSGLATSFEVGKSRYRLSTAGKHFVYSALMAIYLGNYFGIGEQQISEALRTISPADMRGTTKKISGATFIIDCYNANPSSMKSGIELMDEVAGDRPKVAIVGDMLELGKYSRRLHGQLGTTIARSGVRSIIAIGNFASNIAAGALKAGMRKKDIHIAPDSVRALPMVKEIVRPGDVALLKGSRGVHLETIYEGFMQKRKSGHAFTH